MFCWLLPLLVKIDVATLEVNIIDHFQDITKKKFHQKQTMPPHKQTLLGNTFIEEKYFILFSGET